MRLAGKSGEKPYFSHFLVFLLCLLGKQRKEFPAFLGTVSIKNDMISTDRTEKIEAWLRESRRRKAAALIL